MGNTSLVSIVIPAYNIEDVITHSLDAVNDQTYKNFELIIVDDGSSDKTVAVAKEYLVDKQLDYKIFSQENKGLSAARNIGTKFAKGDWILYLDGDDYIVPETLSVLLDAAYKFDASCVFCGFKGVNDSSIKGNVKYRGDTVIISGNEARKKFLSRDFVPLVPGMLMKRKIYDTICFDEECKYCEDVLFLWNLFYKVNRFVYVDCDLYNYYRRSGSIMHSLKPEKYLLASQRHKLSSEKIQRNHPHDDIAPLIYPKFRLAGLRILCRYNSYEDFINTVKADGGNYSVSNLLFQRNAKIFLYASIFLLSKRFYYLVSKMIQ